MDVSETRERKPNPIENSNVFSRLFFCFTCGIFRQGLRKGVNEDNIYKPIKECDATFLGNELEKEWDLQKEKTPLRFFRCLLKLCGKRYVFLGLSVLIIDTPIVLVRPILQGKIVSYFSKDENSVNENEVVYYAGLLLSSTFIRTIFYGFYCFAFETMTLKLKMAISTLLYRKSLKLNSFATSHQSSKTVTLITKDVDMLDDVFYVMPSLISGVLQSAIMGYIVYKNVGISTFPGVAALIAVVPLHVLLGKKVGTFRKRTAKETESRVRITQEILTAVRIIKMYTWELFFSRSVEALRKREIRNLRFLFYIKESAYVIGHLNSKLALYISIMTYIALGNYITAEKAFIVVGCFGTLSVVFTILMPWGIAKVSEMRTAMKRFTAFLNSEEISKSCVNTIGEKQEPNISVKDAEVKCNDGTVILNEITLSIKSGLTLFTGPIGSGKSTFLKLLLGDVNKNDGIVEITGNMSYASQEPWLFPGTVRQNIIFNEGFDQKRYEIVVKVCALQKDFQDLSNGDKTYLTDRGLNLSRGQKTRINLARAVYKRADIYLLDDCLSAVDPHVAKHIFNECIKGFLKDKMCVLVTHQEHLLKEADDIIALNKGSISFHGSYDNLKNLNKEYFEALIKEGNEKIEQLEKNKIEEVANEFDDVDETSKLLLDVNVSTRNIYQEVAEEGSVSKKVYLEYFKSGGGIKMILLVLAVAIAAQIATSWSEYFVSFWVDMEQELSGFKYNQTTNSTEFKNLEEAHDSIMVQYSLVIFGAIALTFLKVFVFYILTCKASVNIHNAILKKIINAVMTFFDANLSGNIINRLSRDLGILDEQLASTICEILSASMTLFGVLFVISSVNTVFLIPSIFFMGILYFIRRLYLPTARSIRRLEGATRSPVIGQFSATLDGLTTIRASDAESLLTKEFEKHLDVYNSAVHMHLSTTRSFSFYVNIVCDLYVALIILTFLIFSTGTLAGKVGLAISQAFTLIGWLQWGVREWAEFENKMTSAERVLEYNKIEEEDKSGNKINNWPHSGNIIYSNVSLCYSATGEKVLKDVNFTINSKNKIGIVGRTGAGKTSIISTLFRLYEFEGMVSIDDIDTKNVSVELLRSKISIIPQDPVLFSGTIRSNLDPYDEYTDKQLWSALEEVELKHSIESLEDEISEGGYNFSVGQKQLICLARAIIRNNIILVLDEATANMDSQTDALIQKTIKRNFVDCTVITIAHRINTIIDSDKVLVMDSGRVVEYDNPQVLLADRDSTFYKMAHDAGLV
ncbi:hypothetical protein ILUMI_24863 [Ignelater luminosus]|uniref:Multidrug resistance-associated protein lethal(2)03659 n=1 Tax=Ignelater luminosus TaxID=2038154 RepID=A0A8K0FYC8_IGNLU|nr:hypothetical protein ILUMI_24863 [Ignelater luminosus]